MCCPQVYGACEKKVVGSVHKVLQKVCVDGAVGRSTLGYWARRLFVKDRCDDVAVHTQHRQTDRKTDANVERVKRDCGR
jgi:hypothetical protein